MRSRNDAGAGRPGFMAADLDLDLGAVGWVAGRRGRGGRVGGGGRRREEGMGIELEIGGDRRGKRIGVKWCFSASLMNFFGCRLPGLCDFVTR